MPAARIADAEVSREVVDLDATFMTTCEWAKALNDLPP
jgi:hypothetical protein